MLRVLHHCQIELHPVSFFENPLLGPLLQGWKAAIGNGAVQTGLDIYGEYIPVYMLSDFLGSKHWLVELKSENTHWRDGHQGDCWVWDRHLFYFGIGCHFIDGFVNFSHVDTRKGVDSLLGLFEPLLLQLRGALLNHFILTNGNHVLHWSSQLFLC